MSTQTGTAPPAAAVGLPKKARCIEPIRAAKDRHLFLVGTLGFQEDNEIHLLSLRAGTKDSQPLRVETSQEFAHKEEIWSLASSPVDEHQFFACCRSAAVLYRRSPLDEPEAKLVELQRLTHPGTGGGAHFEQVVWNNKTPSALLAQSPTLLQLWDLTAETCSATPFAEADSQFRHFYAARWDPHFENQVWCLDRGALKGWDLRAGQVNFVVEQAHEQGARALDLNVNKAYHLVTGGDDSYMRFWDNRQLADGPVKQIREAHTHWITCVSYHPFHDQLIVSAGTDGIVKLWDFRSVSSLVKPSATAAAAAAATVRRDLEGTVNIELPKAPLKEKKDGLLQEYQDHEESVYGLSWTASEADTWFFGSISYDGRLAFNRVPPATEWNILGIQPS